MGINSNRVGKFCGVRFGTLTVIRRGRPPEGVSPDSVWFCQCDCGREVFASTEKLSNKKFTISCGFCLPADKVSKKKEKVYGGFFSSYTGGAKARGLDFSLTEPELVEIAKGNCHYCNQAPTRIFRLWVGGVEDFARLSGVDRMDSSLGYCLSNCVPCCWTCNRMKSDIPYLAFIDKCSQISAHATKLH